MELKEVGIEIVKKNINVKGIVFDILDEVLEEALKSAVAKSENKIDDMLMASVYPIIEKELKELIEKKLGEFLSVE